MLIIVVSIINYLNQKFISSIRINQKFRISYPLLFFFLLSCNVQKQIGHLATTDILNNAALQSAHIGISVYDPASNKYLYNYQGDKYFVPASNTKLFSLYAGM